MTRRLPEAHPQALGEAVPHLLPLALELLPQGMDLLLLHFRGRRFGQFPLFVSPRRGQSIYRHVLRSKLLGQRVFLSLSELASQTLLCEVTNGYGNLDFLEHLLCLT